MTHRFILAPLHFILIIAFLLSACMPGTSATPVPMPTVASLRAEPVADLGQRPSPTPVPTAAPTPAPKDYPRVVNHLPKTSSVSDLTPNIAFVFNQPMDMASLTAAFQVTPEVDYALRWNKDRLEVALDHSLNPGTNYKFTIDTTARSELGLPLRSAFNWTLYVQPVLKKITGPTFKAPEGKVTLEFNYPLTPGSLQKSIQFSPPLEGKWAWNPARTTATFTVDGFYAPETHYKVSFKEALISVGGAVLAPPPTLSFKTPLAVAAITPVASSRSVDSEVVIFFSQQMDHASAEAAFSITPALPGTLAWQGNNMVFTPNRGYLDELLNYTVTIAASAQSAHGQPVLIKDYSHSFKTGTMPQVASFGYGTNIQVMDAAGRRALHYVVYDGQIKSLGFSLHQLTPDQFLDRYITSLGSANDYDMTPISLEDAPLVSEWASEVIIADNSWRSVNEVVIPADVPPGLYVLNMAYGHVNDQILVLLTNHTLLIKQSENEMLAWVTNTNDGPAAGTSVSVYDQEGQLITQGTADAEGLYRATFTESARPLLVVAGSGSDLAATGFDSQWQTGSSSRNATVPAAARSLSAYIYTDRPIYKPGQTIYYKAIVRRDNEASPQTVPQGTAVIVRIRDARNNVVQTRQRLTTLFGTINGEFDVAAGAMLGNYAVEIELDGDIQRQIFKVQDYRKPDYEVKVTTDAAGYVNGGPIQITVEARYLYGEPVAKAQISLKQFRLERNYCLDFCIAAPTWYEFAQKERAGVTDADGRYTFTVEAGGLSSNDYYYGWSDAASATVGLEVTVDDGSHQTVSSLASVKVYEVAEQVTLKTNGYLKAPNQPFEVTLSALDVIGQPVVNRTLAVQVREWSPSSGNYLPTQPALSFTTGPDGTAIQSLSLPNTGYYQLYINSQDAYGHEFEMSRWLYVWDGAERWTGASNEVKITADRDTYAPGDTATLIIQSPISGPALLTFERASLLREQVVQLTAPITRITVPVLANDAPNVFVALNLWLPRDTTLKPTDYQDYGGSRLSGVDSLLQVASVELHVPVTSKTLNVTITPNKPTYAPREEATFTVRVTDYKGDPVAGEVSLALVDDAIFQLSDELSGPIFDAFYSERDNLVRTYNAMAPYRYLPCECGGGGGGGGELSAGNPRSNFPDTAAWVPVLTTNENGEATVTFAMPDTLTRWRLTAKATTADTQVGETAITVTTYQPIIVRPLLPRTLTEGDVFDLSTVIYNYSDEAQKLIVALDASDLLTTTDPLTRTLTLPAGAQIVVGWTATAAQAGEASLTFSAITPGFDSETGYGDSIHMPVTIQPLAIPNLTTSVGNFTDSYDLMLNLPEGASSLSSVRIELSRSIAGSLLNGLDYLTGFPYGCVEQTMSKALPNAVVGRAFYQLGLSSPSLQGELPAKVNASIQRLYGYQHDDGGWGWWYDDNTNAYQTAWVIYGLSMTAEAGYEVDSGVIKRGADWLDSHLSQMDKRTRAFALYSMAQAGYGNLEATKALVKNTDSMDSFSLAALALAFHKQGSAADAQQVLTLLETSAVIKDGQVHWVTGLNDGHYQQKTMASDTRSTALALSAFVAIQPGHAFEAGIVSYLMSQRKQSGWGTTNETSFTIVALTDYLVAQQLETPSTNYTVTLNGQLFASGTLGKEEPNAVLELPASALHTGANSLRISQEGGEQLYYVVNQRTYVSQSQVNAAGEVKVSRAYFDGKTNRPISGPVTAGQLVRVAITVDMSDSAFYLLVVDNLPGGFEALNESLNTTSHVSLPNPYDTYETSFGRYGYNNKEIYADHVNFFITELSQSRRILSYFVRAVRAGTFVAMPAELTAMYDSTLWGRSSSARIVVVEK